MDEEISLVELKNSAADFRSLERDKFMRLISTKTGLKQKISFPHLHKFNAFLSTTSNMMFQMFRTFCQTALDSNTAPSS